MVFSWDEMITLDGEWVNPFLLEPLLIKKFLLEFIVKKFWNIYMY